MNTHHTKQIFLAMIVIVNSGVDAGVRTPDPSPTPTKCPKRLGDIKLKTVAIHDEDGRVVISDANIADLAGRGSVTIGGRTAVDSARPGPRTTPSSAERERWRNKVLDQKEAIVELEKNRLRIEARIDLIEDGSLTVRALARIQSAEIDLRAVEREIRDARAELGRLIREARRHGAEPGWFR